LITEILDLRGEWNFEFVATLWIANKNTYAIILFLLRPSGAFGISITKFVFRVSSGQGKKH